MSFEVAVFMISFRPYTSLMEHLTKVQLQNRMKNNFVNIDNPDLYIYRVFKVNRLIEMFKTKKLVLVKPELWNDPFENFLIKNLMLCGEFTLLIKTPLNLKLSLELIIILVSDSSTTVLVSITTLAKLC